MKEKNQNLETKEKERAKKLNKQCFEAILQKSLF